MPAVLAVRPPANTYLLPGRLRPSPTLAAPGKPVLVVALGGSRLRQTPGEALLLRPNRKRRGEDNFVIFISLLKGRFI